MEKFRPAAWLAPTPVFPSCGNGTASTSSALACSGCSELVAGCLATGGSGSGNAQNHLD